MSEQTRTGVLRWNEAKQQLRVIRDDAPKSRPKVNPEYDLGPALADHAPSELDGLRVEFRWFGGKAQDVRPTGTAATPKPRRVPVDAFVNPYTFLPATPRPSRPDGSDGSDGTLGEGPPPAQDRLHKGHFTGRIPVRLTVVTPLLLLDPSRADQADNGHLTYPLLRRDGRPHLPVTTVKGMLRAAYEAVTNSRMGVFTGHDERLAVRMPAAEAQHMVPARVSDDGRQLVLLPGDTPPGHTPPGGQADQRPPLHAAWLPRYDGPALPVTDTGGQDPVHGDAYEAWLERIRHWRWNRRDKQHTHDFDYWRVRTLAPADGPLPDRPEPAQSSSRLHGKSWHEPTGELKAVRGWACLTNRNINGKHDERLFFASSAPEQSTPLTQALRNQWEKTIRNYRAAHRTAELYERTDRQGQQVGPDAHLGPEPGRTAWSPHQYDDSWLSLRPGSLCYARMAPDGRTVQGVYPVMIARRLFPHAPAELLDPSLRPATSRTELTPADRVFGWVNQSGHGAERGRLRIGPVDTAGFVPADFGEAGVPLAILSGPKPQQARFYLGNGPDGTTPLPDGATNNTWYTKNQRPRGRKAYWHHSDLPDGYWDDPTSDRTQQPDSTLRFQEYRRPDQNGRPQRDKQNRSVRGWITPGSSATFTLSVSDLTAVELGALVWLLQLPDDHCHRLGLGKPLGFGSVRLDIDPEGTLDLRTEQQWRTAYRSLSRESDRPMDDARSALTHACEAFEADMERTYGAPAGRPPHLAAFLSTSAGRSGTAVHYPRTYVADSGDGQALAPDPDGNNYAWFTANERIQNSKPMKGRGLSLPSWHEPNLPLRPGQDH
ncbi:TIGR03986 family CRISPR-associated RAMP protein [Streptomyces sp. XM4193]|uniref:TIGR03986 family type III CRISPR-associated RAMP protein n=1 Tax=Streptomyces sp. XM4193 TaxID=2929782 RepID=UPI001FFBD513|nr:TIGR03986 family CRISPR-associated RAMP protein [Streptomyces sp. XM4193]MCK1797764.1 TIGR03986 family CRISPR-associated RAMP protein [Streptomyces sp. XM4193]